MLSLGPISGLSSAWLATGAAACAIPVVLHLARRRRRTVLFPPAALMVDESHASRWADRPHEWLILALRMAIIALLALAFDQPELQTHRGLSGALAGAPRDLILVIDQSASMQRIDNGRTLFDHARARAIDRLDELRPGVDRAGVVFLRRDSIAALPELTVNHAALRARIDDASGTLEQGDLTSASAAIKMLAHEYEDGQPEIVVMTDGQSAQWGEAPVAEALDLGASGIQTEVLGDPEDNVRLGALTIEPSPGDGATARIGAPVTNFGTQSRMVQVSLRAGEVVHTKGAELAPGATTTVRFDQPYPRAGEDPILLHASISSDAALYDNESLSWLAHPSARRTALFGVNSLAGFGAHAVYGAISAIDGPPRLLESLTQAPTEEPFDLIVAMGVSSIDWSALQSENGLLALDGVVFMLPTEQDGAGQRPAERFLRILDAERLLQINEAPARGELARLIETTPISALHDPPVPDDATVFARFEDGVPFAAEWVTNGVRVAFMNAVIDPDGDSFTRSPLLPVFMQGVFDRVSPSKAKLERCDIGSAIKGGARVVAQSAGFTEPESDALQVVSPGAAILQDGTGHDVSMRAVVASSESDLSGRIDVKADVAMQERRIGEHRAIALWPWMLLLAMSCFGVEARLTRAVRARTRGGLS